MKKIGSLVLALVMAAAMTACSDANTISSTAATNGANTTTTQGNAGGDTTSADANAAPVDITIDTTGNFVFAYDGVDILLGSTDTDTVISALGDAKSMLDVPSCAHDGTDHVYTYDNMVLTVYEPTDGGAKYISDVMITSDLVATPEGLEIGMSGDDASSKYGDPDESTDTTMTYKRGTSVLLITLSAGSIISIEYLIP